MNPPRRVGLAGGGAVSRSFVARLPTLLAQLGPVVGSSFRVSRRIANALRHGCAAPDYSAFQHCESIWLAGPESWMDRVSRELGAAVPLGGKTMVLCDTWRNSRWPSAAWPAGARVASLNCIPETDEKSFLAEGHPEALKMVRGVLSAERRKVIEIQPAMKTLYLAGTQCAAHLLLPWIASAVELLRAAGFSRLEATQLVSALGFRAVRGYCRGGPKAWNPARVRDLREAVARGRSDLRSDDARLIRLYESGIDLGSKFFEPRASRRQTTS
jgi:hypothetical protein